LLREGSTFRQKQDREQECKQDRALETKAPWISRKCKTTSQRWYETLRTILVGRSIEVAKSGQLAPAKYLFEAVGFYPQTAENFGKAGKFAGLHVAEANGFADGPTKLRERSNGFDDKRSETSNAAASEAEADSGGEKGRESTAGRMPQ
jgi:hypothetical protein